MHPSSARPMGRSWLRLLLVLAWIAAAMAVPVTVVKACSCGFLGYPEAIRQADVAFIGEAVGREEMADDGFVDDVMPEAAFAFHVERAKGPMDDRAVIAVATGDGGSCGLGLEEGDQWLIIAHLERGKARTNLCSGSAPYDQLPEDARPQVDAMLTVTPTATVSPDDESDGFPAPAAVVGAVALLIGLASVVAFRQRPT